MNVKNYRYLTGDLRICQFGNDLDLLLQTKLLQAPSTFTLDYTARFGKHSLKVALCVRKWTRSDVYFFQKYLACTAKEDTGEIVAQAFYFNRFDPMITLEEAYELLQGRPLYRDKFFNGKDTYFHIYIQLDFNLTSDPGTLKWPGFKTISAL